MNAEAWLEESILSSQVLTPGDEGRSLVFDRIRDGSQPMVARLLAHLTDGRAPVRRTILVLLAQPTFADDARKRSVADAAEHALTDPDQDARRAAARLLAKTAEPGRALAALDASADPDVRIPLAEDLPWAEVPDRRAVLLRLRSDLAPAIRLLAAAQSFERDDPAVWPELDAAIRADLEACADEPLRWTAGEHWTWTMTVLDREEVCYSWAKRLTDPAAGPEANRAGVRMALDAMREWRAAPARLAPALIALLDTGTRAAALHALAASTTASRLAAGHLAARLDDPELGATAAAALQRIGAAPEIPAGPPSFTEPPRFAGPEEAVRVLDERRGIQRVSERELEALTWLAEHGGLTAERHARLRTAFGGTGFSLVRSARAIWLTEGPEVAPELLAAFPEYLFDDLYGPPLLRVLAEMGEHARPILGPLDEFITRRHRAGFSFGDADAEMRADEMMLALCEQVSCVLAT